MTRLLLTAGVLVASLVALVHSLSLEPYPPPPTPDCQRWCPRPGQFGEYDCCDTKQESCVDNWPGICIDGLHTFDNGTQIKVGGCSCAEIKGTGWCDFQGTEHCRKTCGFCTDDNSGPIGNCPDTTGGTITDCGITIEICWSDSQCPRGTRCCSRGCRRECLPVV